MELVGKVVGVAGGGSGIGREVAPKLAIRLIYRQTKSLRFSP
ncbi:MAG TPA: hypothetical protein VLA91_09685 [Acidimicrobiia bacterium]|nr:hypothetical protein [Acidimicrobiia bacterium]